MRQTRIEKPKHRPLEREAERREVDSLTLDEVRQMLRRAKGDRRDTRRR